jgi:hypothetical protein
LPLKGNFAYEGYLLPGFPIEFVVQPDRAVRADTHIHNNDKPLCRIHDLLETSTGSALEKGRWLITAKNVDEVYDASEQTLFNQGVSLKGYQRGLNSLGFKADYVYSSCALLSEQVVRDTQIWNDTIRESRFKAKAIRVLFIGDSNMRKQEEMFRTYFGGLVESEEITTSGGIVPLLPSIIERLDVLKLDTSAQYFVIFNTGLHDLDKLCVARRRPERDPYINVTDEEFFCFDEYRRQLERFVQAVKSFPSILTVWQTTTAGWPKWGNTAPWRPGSIQNLPSDASAVAYLNDIAWDILSSRDVPVMDAYWLTLARPDHRDVNEQNAIGKRMVHGGPEIYSVLTRKWAMMILESLRG